MALKFADQLLMVQVLSIYRFPPKLRKKEYENLTVGRKKGDNDYSFAPFIILLLTIRTSSVMGIDPSRKHDHRENSHQTFSCRYRISAPTRRVTEFLKVFSGLEVPKGLFTVRTYPVVWGELLRAWPLLQPDNHSMTSLLLRWLGWQEREDLQMRIIDLSQTMIPESSSETSLLLMSGPAGQEDTH